MQFDSSPSPVQWLSSWLMKLVKQHSHQCKHIDHTHCVPMHACQLVSESVCCWLEGYAVSCSFVNIVFIALPSTVATLPGHIAVDEQVQCQALSTAGLSVEHIRANLKLL